MSAAKLVPESKLQHRVTAAREQSKHRTELIDDEEFFQGYLLSQTPAASWSSRHTEVRRRARPALAHSALCESATSHVVGSSRHT